MFNLLVEGLGMSMAIFALTIVGAIPLGIPVALARLSKFKPLALLAQFYISVMRGTPLMLQMFAVYFMPYYVFNIQTGSGFKFTACIIAFILNYAAYFAEIYRSGIQSIPHGQYVHRGQGTGRKPAQHDSVCHFRRPVLGYLPGYYCHPEPRREEAGLLP